MRLFCVVHLFVCVFVCLFVLRQNLVTFETGCKITCESDSDERASAVDGRNVLTQRNATENAHSGPASD